MSQLPKVYVPSSMQPQSTGRTQVIYAAGYEEKPGSFSMFNGPTPVLLDLLEIRPLDEDPNRVPCIIRFNVDATDDVLYRWDMLGKTGWRLEEERHQCHDCGVQEGELHHPGCDMERCPFCGGQLISCRCCYKLLNIDVSLGTWAYSNGLTDEEEAAWGQMLREKGRVPYVVYPNMCARCGCLWPEMFHVSSEEWQHYVRIDTRHEMLCRSCYDYIKNLIDTHAKEQDV